MDAPSGEFNFTRLERVIFGPGKIEALGKELEKRGLSRAVVVTGQEFNLGNAQLANGAHGLGNFAPQRIRRSKNTHDVFISRCKQPTDAS